MATSTRQSTRTTRTRRSASPPSASSSSHEDRLPTPSNSSSLPQDFHQRVYELVRQVPEGRVTSYGSIARLLGYPKHSRHVGQALKLMPRRLALPHLSQQRGTRQPRQDEQDDVESDQEANLSAHDQGERARRQRRGRARGNSPTDDLSDDDGGQPGHNHDGLHGDSDELDDDDVLPEPEPNPEWVPWHRVVSSSGVISPRGSNVAVRRQADWLRAEGVEVGEGPRAAGGGNGQQGWDGAPAGVDAFGLGGVEGGRVSMTRYGWAG
ncbi:Alkyltransferase-like protein 1 [Microbotryomycetes sp. JL221]|nr:Alkyltransferase-like protein 1 [Microbotryomycetes sp. JL221]